MDFKEKVHLTCLTHIQEKRKALMEELAAVKEASTAETKSSMGDKYETGREMMMQETNKLGAQLVLMDRQIAMMHTLAKAKHEQVKEGSLVQTDTTWFYISIPLGQITIGRDQIFAISPHAPISKVMIGKTAGDTFTINNRSYFIKSIT